MLLKWVSNSTLTPTVQYGLSNASFPFTSFGNYTSYAKSDFCTTNENAIYYFIHPGFIHQVILSNLTANTLYYYRYGSNDSWSPVRSFRSRPVTTETGFRAILFGDMGVGDEKGLLGPSCKSRLYQDIHLP